ncbi:MAG: molybdenum cofactor guanylyltransferase [Dehalococcoidia bacterium]
MSERTEATGIVLAGGRSSRMGTDKASLILDGLPLLQRTVTALSAAVAEIVIVRAPGQSLPSIESVRPLSVAEDAVEGEGPLIGIAAGLREAHHDVALVVACDMPFLQAPLLRLLLERAAAGRRFVVPMHLGRPQPLCSAFRRDALPVVEAQIEAGERRIMAVADGLDADRVPSEQWSVADVDGRSFENVNTPEELKAALASLASE